MSDTDRVERVAEAIDAARHKHRIGYVAPGDVIDSADRILARAALAAADQWLRGFPPKSGMYHVALNDGEQIITPWSDGTDRDDNGDLRRPGWSCLSDWRGRVVAYRPLPAPPEAK